MSRACEESLRFGVLPALRPRGLPCLSQTLVEGVGPSFLSCSHANCPRTGLRCDGKAGPCWGKLLQKLGGWDRAGRDQVLLLGGGLQGPRGCPPTRGCHLETPDKVTWSRP